MVKPIDTRQLIGQLAAQIEEIATRQGRIPYRTGQLQKSITSQVLSDTEAVVGSNLFYARFVHDGTGIYGPLQRKITPRRKKALYWKDAAHPVKSVRGQKPQPFLAEAVEEFARVGPATAIIDRFGRDVADAIALELQRQGLEVKRG